METRKILIHISDRDKWSSAVRVGSACNPPGTPEAVQIIILADVFAGAVCLACDRNLRAQMEELCKAGHRILVCEQSLLNLNLRPESLPEFIERTPVGLLEIVRLQDEGYHYIKL